MNIAQNHDVSDKIIYFCFKIKNNNTMLPILSAKSFIVPPFLFVIFYDNILVLNLVLSKTNLNIFCNTKVCKKHLLT